MECKKCGRPRVQIPLVRGGTDDIGNVVPACRPCNTKKNRHTAIEYLAARGAA